MLRSLVGSEMCIRRQVQYNDHTIDAIRYALSRINAEPVKFITEEKYKQKRPDYNEDWMWEEI